MVVELGGGPFKLGRPAGVGPLVVLELAMRETRPGDTLVIALESALLTEPEIPALGYQVLLAEGAPARPVELAPAREKFAAADLVGAVRPGAYHVFTMAGKLAAGRPLYRYTLPEVSQAGWGRTAERYPLSPEPPRPVPLGPQARRMLGQVREWGAARGVTIFLALPWAYTAEAVAPAARAENLRLARDLLPILPVLRDEALGIHTEPGDFADTPLHLSESGARKRTARTGERLRARLVWDEASLVEAARNLPPPRPRAALRSGGRDETR